MIKKKIIEEIVKSKIGISLENFINICLYDENGYYNKLKFFGKSGDFTTAPEISQLFGEVLGVYIYFIWQQKYNSNFNLIELGSGNGTLLVDMLRITRKFNNFHKNININIIEINKHLIDKQKKKLHSSSFKNVNFHWHKNFEKIKLLPSIIIANEFFDCFPIRQFQNIEGNWFEKFITYNKNNGIFSYKKILVKNKMILNKLIKYKEENFIEISEQRKKYFSKICSFLNKAKGTLIAIDYGYFNLPNKSTIQTVYNNKHSNLFDNLGKQDITSLVNFKEFIDIANKFDLKVDIFTTQKDFLIQNGILERKNIIIDKCEKKQKDDIESGLERLINKQYMGNIFKFLILSNKNK